MNILPQDRGIIAYLPPADLDARRLVNVLRQLGHSAEFIELPPEAGISGWTMVAPVTSESRTKVTAWGWFHEPKATTP